MYDFEETFFLHKLESIRGVNEWLEAMNPKTITMCMRQITTLCFAEVCRP